jgi:hypothetical protein
MGNFQIQIFLLLLNPSTVLISHNKWFKKHIISLGEDPRNLLPMVNLKFMKISNQMIFDKEDLVTAISSHQFLPLQKFLKD